MKSELEAFLRTRRYRVPSPLFVPYGPFVESFGSEAGRFAIEVPLRRGNARSLVGVRVGHYIVSPFRDLGNMGFVA